MKVIGSFDLCLVSRSGIVHIVVDAVVPSSESDRHTISESLLGVHSIRLLNRACMNECFGESTDHKANCLGPSLVPFFFSGSRAAAPLSLSAFRLPSALFLFLSRTRQFDDVLPAGVTKPLTCNHMKEKRGFRLSGS